MGDFGGNSKPEFHAGFLFLIDLAGGFRDCAICRRNNDIQKLVRVLESLSLSLKGYYTGGKKEENEIKEKVIKARRELDKILKNFDIDQSLYVSESFYIMLYDLEAHLRDVWKTSGLQMKIKDFEESDDF
jgi:hypothetical protein